MSTLLHIDSSPRSKRSHSRRLAAEFSEEWRKRDASHIVTHRDLGVDPVPHVTEAWVEGVYAPVELHTEAAKSAMSLSDLLIQELIDADFLLISSPMYNLSITSTLKAYLDQVIRPGRTFVMEAGELRGLLSDKKTVVVTSRGGMYAPGTPSASYDYQEPYLRAVLGGIGIRDVSFINAEGMDWSDEQRQSAYKISRQRIADVLKQWDK